MMNGSRYRYAMPAMVRRTGKPSPSKPVGPVDIASTGRSVSPSAASFTRGSTSVSAVTAAILINSSSWLRMQLLREHALGARYSTLWNSTRGKQMLFGKEHVERYQATDGAEGHDWK